MTRDEIDLAVDWAASEGWNPGLYDADSFFAADNEGFLVGELDGEPVGIVSAVRYGNTYGFMGFYIVKPEFRGKGYGMPMWNAGLEFLSNRVIGIDGVVEQQENYKKSGFSYAFRNIRYEGVSGEVSNDNPAIVDLSEAQFESIERYDSEFFPDTRTAFLRFWIRQPESFTLGFMADNTLSGYGTIRRCRNGYKIGPLFADSPGIAEELFKALQSRIPTGQPIFLDTPEPNAEALALAKNHSMKYVFETARMYNGKFPDTPLDRLFGITTFELG